MKSKIAWIIASLTVIAALAACTGSAGGQPERQIRVTGTGRVYLQPDIAYITIGVQSKSENVASALGQNNTQAQAIAAALSEIGVAGEDIQTTAFNVYPLQEYGPEGEILRTVYVVDNSVFVTARDLQSLGQMLEKVVRSGANSINGIQFDVQDKAQSMSEVRKLAIEDARRQAQELADAAGVKLGQLVSLNVYSSGYPVPIYEGKGMGGAPMDIGQVPIAAGQMVLVMNADLAYEIR